MSKNVPFTLGANTNALLTLGVIKKGPFTLAVNKNAVFTLGVTKLIFGHS